MTPGDTAADRAQGGTRLVRLSRRLLPAALLLALVLISFSVGKFPVAPGELWAAVIAKLTGSAAATDPTLETVLWQVRLPRVVAAILVGAGISLVKILADPYDQLPAITYWLLGSLASVTSADTLGAVPAILVGLAPLYLLRWRMNLMALGEEEARALGLETRILRPVLIAAATLVTAAAVSISGVVGWVGLVVPHVARMLVGPDLVRLLPASLLLGAGFLVAVDTLARTLSAIEVPLGILTAVLGVPFFLWLLATSRRGWQ